MTQLEKGIVWNPYYLMIEEAFDVMCFNEGIYSGLTLLAAIDIWLSNCRLVHGETDELKEWQAQADFRRDAVATLYIRKGITPAEFSLSKVKEIDSTLVSILETKLTHPVEAWRSLEASAGNSAFEGRFVNLEFPSNVNTGSSYSGLAVKKVADWFKIYIIAGCSTKSFSEVVDQLRSLEGQGD